MNRFLKKILGLGLVSAMLTASMAGCSDANSSSSNPTQESGSSTSTASSSGEVFKIGGMGPLTGPNASYGISVKNGAQIAVNEINAAGGVNGMTLELLFADDEAEPETATSAYNQLMDKGIQAMMGATTSGATIALTDLTAEDGILQLTPSGSAMECTKNDNCFRICFTDPLQGTTMADYAVDTLGYKKIAVIYDIASDYSKGIAEAFIEQVKAKNCEIVANESFTTGDVDFNTQLTTIKSSGAEVLFIPTYYQEVSYIVTQAAKLGMDLPYLGADGWDGVLGQMKDDVSPVEGAIFLTPFSANDQAENVKSFVSTYQKDYNAVPDQFAADAYDAIYVIKAALEKAGTVESKDIIAAMTQIEVDGLTGKMTFDASGEPNKAAKMVEIKDGAYSIR